MKKFLPLILFALGILVVIGAYFLVSRKSNKGADTIEEEDTSALIEVALQDRPVATLTPRTDGHWLDLEVSKMGKISAESMEYEVIYQVPGKGQQGTGGTVKLASQTTIEKEVLLGSESSGNYYYDKGVEEGTLTLRFRDSKGRLIAKFASDFHLQSNTDELTSLDEKFTFSLDKVAKDYFVTMMTIGYPDGLTASVQGDPYGVFTSSSKILQGKINLAGTVQTFSDNMWRLLVSGESTSLGIFVITNQ